MTATVLLIFGLVYVGMILGGLPLLRLNRTGIALLGAIAMIASKALTVPQAAGAIDVPTVLLLFAFMVVAAQMQLGGFYDWVIVRLESLPLAPPLLLAALIALAALLSAVFSNDVVCLTAAPVLIDATQRRRLDPVPFALALACAANIGSAATLIGNPQNMLIGQTLHLPFVGYAAQALVPVVAGLGLTWALVVLGVRGRWGERAAPAAPPAAQAMALDRWQTLKGLAVAGAVLAGFLWSSWPREVVALTGAGVLLMSARFQSSKMLGLVDWELLVLFIGLFVVNAALQSTGVPARVVAHAGVAGMHLDHPGSMFAASFVLSNVVSNVPAVMLLLPFAHHPTAGPLLALSSTLAGNLFIVGSIANIIVVDAARRKGVEISWRRHAAVGVPVTLSTLAVAAACFFWGQPLAG